VVVLGTGVVVVGILVKPNVVNNVDNCTGVEAAFSTVCWRDSKLVRVVNKVLVTAPEAGLVVVVSRGLETGLVVVVDLGLDTRLDVVVDLGLETGLVVVVDLGLVTGLVVLVCVVEDLV